MFKLKVPENTQKALFHDKTSKTRGRDPLVRKNFQKSRTAPKDVYAEQLFCNEMSENFTLPEKLKKFPQLNYQ